MFWLMARMAAKNALSSLNRVRTGPGNPVCKTNQIVFLLKQTQRVSNKINTPEKKKLRFNALILKKCIDR